MEGEHADARVGQRIMDPAMVTVEDFSRLVSGIYAAAVTPQHWEPAHPRHVTGTLDGTGGGVVMCRRVEPMVYPSTRSFAPEPPRATQSITARLDHVLAAVENGPVGAVRPATELIAPQPITEFHADWIRPNELEDGLFVRLNRRDDDVMLRGGVTATLRVVRHA